MVQSCKHVIISKKQSRWPQIWERISLEVFPSCSEILEIIFRIPQHVVSDGFMETKFFVFLMLRCYHLAQDILAASHRVLVDNSMIRLKVIYIYDSLAKICHMTSPSHQKSRRAILLCTWEAMSWSYLHISIT